MEPSPPPPDSPPALPEELIEEILLRLPPYAPSCLLRAALVCKPWRSVIRHRGFHRRLHELNGTFSLALPDCPRYGRALDFRHGRALLLCSNNALIVWDPIAGDQRLVFGPDEVTFCDDPAAAVVCAADGCDHRGCRGGPFRIVFVSIARSDSDGDGEHVVERPTSACVYSSETDTWGEIKSIHNLKMFFREHTASVLVGKSLLYFVSDHGEIVEYDLARCSMARISPAFEGKTGIHIHLILTEDGGLGAAESSLDSTSIHLWSGDVSDHSNARWIKGRVIRLDNALPHAALSSTSLRVMGFAEGANTILFRTADGVFTIELKSEHAKKLREDGEVHTLVPIARFYAPCLTTLERAQELFDRGSEAINKGDFVNALDFLSHAINIRVARYGNFTPECDSRYYKYGCALKETQGVSDPLFNVPKSASNEQSVKSTTCKDDTVNSKTPGRNMEDSSPLKKGDFEEGQNSNGKDQEDGSSDSDYDDDSISDGESDSDIDMAWEMLDIAGALVEKSPDNAMEEVKILSALAEVCLKRDDVDDSLSYYLRALFILERLLEHDDRRIVELYPLCGNNSVNCLPYITINNVFVNLKWCRYHYHSSGFFLVF
ncbi:unnamed protein product [Alopecurus aequalis]